MKTDKRTLSVPTSEQLLVDATEQSGAQRVLCTSLGRGQFARTFQQRLPTSHVCCHFLDLAQMEATRAEFGNEDHAIQLACEPDFPADEFDLVALPFSSRGDAELTRDLMQCGHDRLAVGGRMIAATDNPNDQWLHGEMKKLFDKLTRQAHRKGVVYLGTKTGPLRKHKNFECEFAFRDRGRLIRAFSRPSVFSHRRLDLGARALIESVPELEQARVLDLGCGSGTVSLAVAARSPAVKVTAVDSNPRAVQCVLRGAELNGLTNIEAYLDANANVREPAQYDVVVANPPYYSHFRIAEIFLRGAEVALRSGGELLVVTKTPGEIASRLPGGFRSHSVAAVRTYSIVRAVRA